MYLLEGDDDFSNFNLLLGILVLKNYVSRKENKNIIDRDLTILHPYRIQIKVLIILFQ